jgi:hypothetical protein
MALFPLQEGAFALLFSVEVIAAHNSLLLDKVCTYRSVNFISQLDFGNDQIAAF